MTPTEREAMHPPEVVEAWHWLDINCRHYATPNSDQQTANNLSPADLATAHRHLETLRRNGMMRISKSAP